MDRLILFIVYVQPPTVAAQLIRHRCVHWFPFCGKYETSAVDLSASAQLISVSRLESPAPPWAPWEADEGDTLQRKPRLYHGTVRDMRSVIALLAPALLVALYSASPQDSPPSSPKPLLARPRLFINPSSTSVKLGKANLTVSPLIAQNNTYLGDYRLKVVPYFFKSEKGRLVLAAPQDSYRRLTEGEAVEFSGVATNQKNGKTKVITGKITPSTVDRGQVTFWVATDNGKMEFNTVYHFAP
jgi:hypothetical protein